METILAAVDFSPVTKAVVAQAVALARAVPARLILLNATTPKSLLADYAALGAVLASAESPEKLEEDVSAIHGESLQLIGEPIDVILEQAARCAADYIVMGSHGHTALFELVFGGTAAGVIRATQCPVILIPAVVRMGETCDENAFRRKDPITCLRREGVAQPQP